MVLEQLAVTVSNVLFHARGFLPEFIQFNTRDLAMASAITGHALLLIPLFRPSHTLATALRPLQPICPL